MSKRLAKSYAIVLIVVLLISIMLGMVIYKPNIHNATIEELQEINGIGEVLSNRISLYLDLNKDACIEDLYDVDGVGRITIKKLKKEWSD